MNEIFKIKRKLIYLINAAFYILFFVIGFLLGGGNIEKISNIIHNFIGNINIL